MGLIFLAEWGDRSQITTIALATHKNPYGVAIGGILGHTFCTSLAVAGGRIVAMKISPRTVSFVGGILSSVSRCTRFISARPELSTCERSAPADNSDHRSFLEARHTVR